MDQNGFIQRHGLATNTHGRAYKNGAALSFEEKVSKLTQAIGQLMHS